jgi:hypothetical protein
MSDGNGWPYYGHDNERPPLDPQFWTEDGLYYQGYLEGQKGRFINNTDVSDVPDRYLEGIKDGYGDWLSSFAELTSKKRLPRPEKAPEGWELTNEYRVPVLDENFFGRDGYTICRVINSKDGGIVDDPEYGCKRWILRRSKVTDAV